MKRYKLLYISIICTFILLTSGCFGGGDGGTTEPSVVTWDKLIWDDGSNDPNTLWED